jgi:hypothetical protein
MKLIYSVNKDLYDQFGDFYAKDAHFKIACDPIV